MSYKEFEEFVSEYHHAFDFRPLLDRPVEVKGRILFGKDKFNNKGACFDVDETLTALGKPSLSRNYIEILAEINPGVKSNKKYFDALDKEIDASPEDADKIHKEYMSLLASCNVTFEQDHEACVKAAEKTIPVKNGRKTISYLEKMGYGIFGVSAARDKAVKIFLRKKFGIPESQSVGTPFKFQDNYLTDESDFVYGRNKIKKADKLLLRYNCFRVLIITDLAYEGKVFVESGLGFALIASEQRGKYPKKVYFKPEMRKDLMFVTPPILAQERAVYVAQKFSPSDIFNIGKLSYDAILKGKKFLRKFSESNKNEFIECLKKLFSIEGLPFPVEKYRVIDKILELRATSEKEDCKKIAKNLIDGIEKYLIEHKLFQTSYLKKLQNFIS
jgi:phosphoserine phosphatase